MGYMPDKELMSEMTGARIVAVKRTGSESGVLLIHCDDAGQHPPPVGSMPGCGKILASHDMNDDLSHFAVPLQKTREGFFNVSPAKQVDYYWVPDQESVDNVQRLVMDRLMSLICRGKSVEVAYDGDGGYRYRLAGQTQSDSHPSYIKAYIAGAEKLLNSAGVILNAHEAGSGVQSMIDRALVDYATGVIDEYNDWLAGEVYEICDAEVKSDANGVRINRQNGEFVIGKMNAFIELNLRTASATAPATNDAAAAQPSM